MLLPAKSLVALMFAAAVAWTAVACGNPTTGAQPGTATGGATATGAQPGTATTGATATAAAPAPTRTSAELLDAFNRRLAAHGEPTLPPGTDVTKGYPFDKTVEASVDATDEARPTLPPASLNCGPRDARSGDISTGHGYINMNCALYGDDWIATTSGDFARAVPGVLALYHCDASDASCLSRGEPGIPGQWRIYTSPIGEGVKIYSQSGPILLILPGQYCFDLTTDAWVLPCDWDGVLRAHFTPVPDGSPAP